MSAEIPLDVEAAPRDGRPDELETAIDPNQPIGTFGELGLRPEVIRALNGMGFLDPMPVQRESFAALMAKRDLIVQSRTGSGKTAAFGIPLAQGLLDPALHEVQALALAPTRELALQIMDECKKIGEHRKLDVIAIYGGAPMGKQIEQLKAGVHMVAGTPGRVLDHLGRGTLKLDKLRVLILDEADEMLSMGFLEEITEIIKRCPTDRQTVLFSATMPDDVERIAQRYMREPEKLALSEDGIGAREIHHAYYMVSGMGRTKDLVKVLMAERPESAIVFCNTREETGFVADYLRKQGLDAEAISSDLSQKDRERVMARCKAKDLKYLVATDIAARGIDISDLSHVINYTFPESAEVYVHRTGRTGRAGKSGIALSLIAPRELGNFYMLKLTYKIKPEERQLPAESETQTLKEAARVEELKKLLGNEIVAEEWIQTARRLWTAEGGEKIVGALIRDRLAAPPRVVAAAAEGEAVEARPPRRDSGRGERDRGPRGAGGGRGERGGGRERGGERGGRDRGPARDTARAAKPAAPTGPTIDTSDGREFWEAWADSKTDAPSDAAPANGTNGTSHAAAEPSAEGGERGRRRRRERGPRTEATPLASGLLRLYLNLGRRDGLTDEELAKFLGEKNAHPIEKVELLNSHTYLIVTEAEEGRVLHALNGSIHGTRDVICERARD